MSAGWSGQRRIKKHNRMANVARYVKSNSGSCICWNAARAVAWTVAWGLAWGVAGVVGLGLSTELVWAERYVAQLENGELRTEDEVREWADENSQPTVAGHAVYDPQNPVRSIIDTSREASKRPEMYVEFCGEDRLPGEVVSLGTGVEQPFDQVGPHFLVRPLSELRSADLLAAGVSATELIRVRLDDVQTVVWQRVSPAGHHPGQVFLRDGGAVAFKSLRWQVGKVSLLTDRGIKELPWSSIAEVHLPEEDRWSKWAARQATLAMSDTERLVQLETEDGGLFTTSRKRLHARHWGDRNRPEAWMQVIQPAWALDPLWIRYRTIVSWEFAAPHQPLLAWWSPTTVSQTAVLAGTWGWQLNRSTLGTRLQVGDRMWPTGFGVHASTTLEWQLPPEVTRVRAHAGIDASIKDGGYVTFRIMGPNDAMLAQQGPMTSREPPVDTGWLPVPPAHDGQRRLRFQADMAAENVPVGADPFDVRDVANWGSPQLEFDTAAWQQRVQQAALSRIPAANGWQTPPADRGSIRLASVLDVLHSREPRFRTVFRSSDRFVVLSRTWKRTAEQQWLAVAAAQYREVRPGEAVKPATVQLRIDGVSAGEFPLPFRDGPLDPEPLVVPVGASSARSLSDQVQVELVFITPEESSWIDWRGTAITAHPPGLKPLFEDEPDHPQQLETQTGVAAGWDSASGFTGAGSLRVSPGLAAAPGLWPSALPIREIPKLGEFRYLVFAWKGADTPGLRLQLAHEGSLGAELAMTGGNGQRRRLRGFRETGLEDRALRHALSYDCGNTKPVGPQPIRLDQRVPVEWKLEARDVYGDFGALQVTGIGYEVLERGTGWFDHVYLARSPHDVERAKTWLGPAAPQPDPDGPVLRQASNPAEWGSAIASFAPRFAIVDARHGLTQLKEAQGQTNAWQTYPPDANTPFALRCGWHVPPASKPMLDLLISHEPQRRWELVVMVNGMVHHQQRIEPELTASQRGFANILVDLSPFAGQKIWLEVQQRAHQGEWAAAFWKRVAIVERGE
jgi:hypothetical protein